MNVEIGKTLYGCTYKTKNISFGNDLITGMEILRVKVAKETKSFIVLDLGNNSKQRVSKVRLGESLFETEKEIIDYIISETKRRLKEKELSDMNKDFDEEHVHYLKKNLKKWEKYALEVNNEVKKNECIN